MSSALDRFEVKLCLLISHLHIIWVTCPQETTRATLLVAAGYQLRFHLSYSLASS